MSIVNVFEIHEGRSANISYPENGIIVKEYKRSFTVITDDATNDGGYVVCKCLSPDCPGPDTVPGFYSPYILPDFVDNDALVKTIVPTPITDYFCAWKVEVSYDNKPYLPATTPLCLPPVWSFSFQKTKEAVEYDVAGNTILNSAKMPIACEREVSVPLINVKWASINWDYTTLYDYADAVTNDVWYGFQPGVLKVEGFSVTQQYDPLRAGMGEGTPPGVYWEKTLTLALRWEGWNLKLLDAGLYALVERDDVIRTDGRATFALQPIRDTHGQPVTTPVPLNGNGEPLLITRRPPFPAPVYLNFQIYRPMPFAPLIDYPSVSPCPQGGLPTCEG